MSNHERPTGSVDVMRVVLTDSAAAQQWLPYTSACSYTSACLMSTRCAGASGGRAGGLVLLSGRLRELESLAECLARGWPALLVGGPSSGKSSLARIAAALAGWCGCKGITLCNEVNQT